MVRTPTLAHKLAPLTHIAQGENTHAHQLAQTHKTHSTWRACSHPPASAHARRTSRMVRTPTLAHWLVHVTHIAHGAHARTHQRVPMRNPHCTLRCSRSHTLSACARSPASSRAQPTLHSRTRQEADTHDTHHPWRTCRASSKPHRVSTTVHRELSTLAQATYNSHPGRVPTTGHIMPARTLLLLRSRASPLFNCHLNKMR